MLMTSEIGLLRNVANINIIELVPICSNDVIPEAPEASQLFRTILKLASAEVDRHILQRDLKSSPQQLGAGNPVTLQVPRVSRMAAYGSQYVQK